MDRPKISIVNDGIVRGTKVYYNDVELEGVYSVVFPNINSDNLDSCVEIQITFSGVDIELGSIDKGWED